MNKYYAGNFESMSRVWKMGMTETMIKRVGRREEGNGRRRGRREGRKEGREGGRDNRKMMVGRKGKKEKMKETEEGKEGR